MAFKSVSQSAQFDLLACSDATKILDSAVDNIGEINSIRELIELNVANITQTGVALAQALIGDLWQTISVGLDGGAGFSQLIELTQFGASLTLSLSTINNASATTTASDDSYEIPLWPATTAERIERNNARLAIINSARMAALINAYVQAGDADYKTDKEIQEARLTVETAYHRLMVVDTDNKDLVQAQPGVRSLVEAVRIAALEILSRKEQSAYSVTTINNRVGVGSFAESYLLYKEEFRTGSDVTDRAIEIRALNPLMAADRLTGTTTVFQK